MNSIQLLNKLSSRIGDLQQAAEQILEHGRDLSALEKEVLKKNCTDIFDLVLRLKTTEDLLPENKLVLENIATERKAEEVVISELFNKTEEEAVSINELAELVNENLHKEEVPPVSVEITEITSFDTPLPEMPEKESVMELLVLEAPVAEKRMPEIIFPEKEKPAPFLSIGKTEFPNAEPRLNEKLQQSQDNELFLVAEKTLEPRIDSLKTAISLNKKIAFVNELFKENVVEYAKSIDKLNNATELNEALLFWTEMKAAYRWDNENGLVSELEKLIHRRFAL